MIQYSPDKKFKDDVETVTIKKASKNLLNLKKENQKQKNITN